MGILQDASRKQTEYGDRLSPKEEDRLEHKIDLLEDVGYFVVRGDPDGVTMAYLGIRWAVLGTLLLSIGCAFAQILYLVVWSNRIHGEREVDPYSEV